MAQKMTADEARRVLIEGGFSLTPEVEAHEATWMDGLPNRFSGWGPQTPDPEHPVIPLTVIDLQWSGQGGTDRYHVWRFDLRRRHH